jgi:aminoglycoside 6'-N-acetyltransferase I
MATRRATHSDLTPLVRLRSALWPHHDEAYHRGELARILGGETATAAVFVSGLSPGAAPGFAEASLRHDYVNGCATSPVVFLEGIYVEPTSRRRGLARELVTQVTAWGSSLGCREMASDALIDNEISHRMHEALGFKETERVIFYRRLLGPTAD